MVKPETILGSFLAWLIVTVCGLLACYIAWGWIGIGIAAVFLVWFFYLKKKLTGDGKSIRRDLTSDAIMLGFALIFSWAIYKAVPWEIFGLVDLGIIPGLAALAIQLTWFYISRLEEKPS